MSLDYPNRNDWLAIRATPRKRPAKYAHVSKPLVTIKDPITNTFKTVLGAGNTFVAGRNAAKRDRRAVAELKTALRAA